MNATLWKDKVKTAGRPDRIIKITGYMGSSHVTWQLHSGESKKKQGRISINSLKRAFIEVTEADS